MVRAVKVKTRQPLGQHFLVSVRYLTAIAECVGAHPGDRVLEIGPGRGALTEALLKRGYRVTAVEKDRRFFKRLGEMGVDVIEGDAVLVPMDLTAFLREREIGWVAGNLPYCAATAILRRYLPKMDHLDGMVFTFQKEVADRITADPGSRPYGALSVVSRIFSRPERVFTIPPGAFSPPPEVDSATVTFLRPDGVDLSFAEFESFLHTAFAQPRKTLVNNLKARYGDLHKRLGSRRPAELTPEEYVDLFRTLEAP